MTTEEISTVIRDESQPRNLSERAASGPAEHTFDADVIGVDVIGFSRFTQGLIDEKGPGAAEEVRNVLDIGFRAVADQLADHGFVAIDSLGDGIILVRERSAGVDSGQENIDQLIGNAERAFTIALGALRVRAAHASGQVNLCRVGGWQGRWDTVATGAAIEALHVAMARRRQCEATVDGDTGTSVLQGLAAAPRVIQPALRDLASIAEIRKLAVVFFAIKLSGELLGAPLATLQDVTILSQRLAEACGGRLEKVTHDDKGLLFNLSFARTRDIGLTALDSALDFIVELQPLLAKTGFSPRFGLAEGFVYRGPLQLGERTISIVHGPAVNLSAKLAASGRRDLALELSTAHTLAHRLPSFGSGNRFVLQNGIPCVAVDLGDASYRATVGAKDSELVGRDADLARLSTALDGLSNGRGGLISLSGPPGIGKTKLLDAFHKSVSPSTNAFWLRGDPRRASQYLSLWRDLMGPLALAMSGDRTQSLATALSAAGIPAGLHTILDDVMPAGNLTALPPLDGIEGIARHDLLARAITAVVAYAAQHNPTLICLDDAQWLDDASCHLLANVLGASPQLLVVLGHRDGHYTHLDQLKRSVDPNRTTHILLDPLGLEAIKAIARSASPTSSYDDAEYEQIFELSGGNPFHTEQIAHWLNGGQAKSVTALARDYIGNPGFLTHVLDQRLDGLTAHETQIVRTLAIFDRPISLAALQTLATSISIHAMGEALASLTANAFVKLGGASAMQASHGLTMNHRLLADAVITRIPPTEARDLHSSAARYLGHLRRVTKESGISDAMVAQHWREAGHARRAAVGFGRAGDAVLYAGAPELAIGLYNNALAVLSRGHVAAAIPRVAGWHAGIAVAHWAQGEMTSALDDASRALSILDDCMGGPAWLPRVLRLSIARFRRVLLAPTGLGNAAVPRGARPPLVMVSAIRAEMAFFLGDIGTMMSSYASMMAFAAEPRLRARARARAYLFLGHMAALLGLHGTAHAAWNSARVLGEGVGDNVASSHGHLGEAIWHMSFGRWREARSELQRAVALYANVADPAYPKFVETLLALEAYFRGDWKLSLERFAALHAVGEKQRNRSSQAWGLYGQAEALIPASRWNEANALLEAAEPIVESMPDRQSHIICKGLRAQIEFAQGRYSQAFERANECLGLARTLAVNNFGSLEGFAAPAEIMLRLALDERAPKSVRANARQCARPALKQLWRFARVHPIARPRLYLCRALAARLRKHDLEAARALRLGLEHARSLDMQFEQRKLEREVERIVTQGRTDV